MEDEVGLICFNGGVQGVEIAHVAPHIGIELFMQAARGKVAFFRGRVERIPHHLGSHHGQPDGQPGAFEAGMTGNQNGFSFIAIMIHDDFSTILWFVSAPLPERSEATRRGR